MDEITREGWKSVAQNLVFKYLDRDNEGHISTAGGDEVPDNCADEILEIVEALLRYRFDWGYKDRDCPVDFKVININKHEFLDGVILREDRVPNEERTIYAIGNVLESLSKSERILSILRHRLYDERVKEE